MFLPLLAAALAQGSAASAPAQAAATQELLLLRFRAEAVDGVDELVLRGREAHIEHREWDPIRGLALEVLAPVPESGSLRIAVREKSGRPHVAVVEMPGAANQRTLRVLIDDGAE